MLTLKQGYPSYKQVLAAGLVGNMLAMTNLSLVNSGQTRHVNSRRMGMSFRGLPGAEQAVVQGGLMPLQISMQGSENRSLHSHFSMASLPEVRLKFGEN